jgi:hypothetical protein
MARTERVLSERREALQYRPGSGPGQDRTLSKDRAGTTDGHEAGEHINLLSVRGGHRERFSNLAIIQMESQNTTLFP